MICRACRDPHSSRPLSCHAGCCCQHRTDRPALYLVPAAPEQFIPRHARTNQPNTKESGS